MAKRPIEELLGGVTRFGRLTLIGEGESYSGKHHPTRRARFRCDCGEIRDMPPFKVRTGMFKSCGCFAVTASRDRFTKHGGYQEPEYKSWNAMIQRCTNPKNTSWADYGGRGITVCERWQGDNGYRNFVADMGARPKGMTMDRIDANGNYEPSNCRWASVRVQQNNRRTSVNITANGETLPQTVWRERLGCGKNTIAERIKKGWTPEQAVLTPVGELPK